MQTTSDPHAAQFATRVAALPPWARLWLALWLRHPHRTFWQFDLTTYRWVPL